MARDSGNAALILIDVINHFEFPEGEQLLRQAKAIARPLALLKKRIRAAGIPVIYVNDNFGQWRSERSQLIKYCLANGSPASEFVREIMPDDEDYFVLKPKHSAFYQSPFETLLRLLGTSNLVLCGLATNSCIVATAHDVNMRDYRLYVPTDCSAARSMHEHRSAIDHFENMVKANVTPSRNLRIPTLSKSRK